MTNSIAIFVLLEAVALVFLANGESEIVKSRSVIGGHDAERYPFYVYLQLKLGNTGMAICGGTILSDTVVVTAAHCVHFDDLGRWAKLNEIQVWVSDFSQQFWKGKRTEFRVAKYFAHSEYDPNSLENDIALLVIDGRFDMKYNKALPICKENESYDKATAIGLGLVSQVPEENPSVLQEALLFEDKNCQSWRGQTDYEKQVCFSDPGRAASCIGDSGGPLVAGVSSQSMCLLGITSFGSVEGCTNHKLASVFTKVSFYQDWITRKTRL